VAPIRFGAGASATGGIPLVRGMEGRRAIHWARRARHGAGQGWEKLVREGQTLRVRWRDEPAYPPPGDRHGSKWANIWRGPAMSAAVAECS